MAGTGFLNDSGATARAVNGFDESARNTKKTMDDLESELVGALNRYSGQQAQAFWQLHRRLHEDMTRASTELDTMSRLVDSARRNYVAGDDQAASILTTLQTQASDGGTVLPRLSGAA